MANLREYHAPQSLQEALRLLAAPGRNYAALAGGVELIGALESGLVSDLDGVVDLSRLGLDTISVQDESITLGAMVTLTTAIEDERLGALAGGLLPRAARGEGPLNRRNGVTVGGLIAAAAYDSEFYAALLALDATVVLHDERGESSRPLAELSGIAGLVTAVTLPLIDAQSGLARVARTPSDRPIVAAVAVVDGRGERIALCGVAERPVLRDTEFAYISNFKASASYRSAMSEIVCRRALALAQ